MIWNEVKVNDFVCSLWRTFRATAYHLTVNLVPGPKENKIESVFHDVNCECFSCLCACNRKICNDEGAVKNSIMAAVVAHVLRCKIRWEAMNIEWYVVPIIPALFVHGSHASSNVALKTIDSRYSIIIYEWNRFASFAQKTCVLHPIRLNQ